MATLEPDRSDVNMGMVEDGAVTERRDEAAADGRICGTCRRWAPAAHPPASVRQAINAAALRPTAAEVRRALARIGLEMRR